MNNIDTKKKAFFMLACVWFIVTFSIIQTTYAKYVTNLAANANISISYWNLVVNTIDIIENSDISEKMEVVLPGNTYALENVIVPGATGYFDLNIDSSNVTVPFSVKLASSINEASTLTKDFVVSGYSINGGEIVELTDITTFSYNIAKDIDSTLIRIYTTWIDDGVDSKEDTALGISGGTAILDVNLQFEQII